MGGTSLPQAAFICCLRSVWRGERLVKGREVYCANGDGAAETGTGKFGGPAVLARAGLLSLMGERRALPIPSTSLGGKLSLPLLSR